MKSDHPLPSSGLLDASEVDLQASPLSQEERRRILSATRLKFTLIVGVVAVTFAMSAMIFVGVSRVFDWLTPSIALDLQRKAQRGANELAQTTQLGVVVRDRRMIASASDDYLSDSDVATLMVLDANGKSLFSHGAHELGLARLLSRRSGVAHDLGKVYGAWAPSMIESVAVGQVALFVSKARLDAGLQMRREILGVAAVGCCVALLVCLLFVSFYIGPILRVTGEAVVRLERTTEAALAAARLKSQFLANMSHEIRTPMNGIVGVLDLLNRTALTSKQQRYTQTIDSSARGLLTIVDDILDFSKLEAGKFVVRGSDFEVRQVAQELVELLAPKAHAKGIELLHRVQADVPYAVNADVDRVKQVLANLLGNAVKFTEQGHVVLRVSTDQHFADGLILRFSIEDTGMGIAPEDQPRLFGVFSQVDGSLTRKHGGTGLGLAICKRLAQAMGGAIGVESRPGEGSTFWFTIKASPAHLAAAGEPMAPRPARALLLSPDDAQRDALCDTFAGWDMTCSATASAESAYDAIMEAGSPGFDVFVVDGSINQSSPAGGMLFDLCAAEGLRSIRLLTANQQADMHESPIEQIHLLKPTRISELYNAVVCVLDGLSPAEARRQRSDDPHISRPDDAATGAKVLVVDDNDINRLVAIDVLTELGYESESACNGAEALTMAERGGYAAILMDCQMPEMDGYEATQRIRLLPEPLCKVPIIALTAHAMVGDRDRVLRAGMDDYTAKPVRLRALERLLLHWIPSAGPEPSVEQSGIRPSQRPCALAQPEPQATAPAQQPSDLAEQPDLDPTLPRSPKIVGIFLRTVPGLLAELSQAVSAGNPAEVQKLAHKLKGNCLSLGASRLAAACQVIEKAATKGSIDTDMHARLPLLFAEITPPLSALCRSKSEPAPDLVEIA